VSKLAPGSRWRQWQRTPELPEFDLISFPIRFHGLAVVNQTNGGVWQGKQDENSAIYNGFQSSLGNNDPDLRLS
jgi:hypothetical protein